MALGGGTFTAMNKVLPGAYYNFVSANGVSASLSDRGIVTMPLELNWGPEAEVFSVEAADFYKKSMDIFGYPIDADELKGLRDLFLHARILYAYRLNGGGAKAACTYATAKYAGTRGNDLKIKIAANVDDNTKWDVSTLVGTTVVDAQTVADATELVANGWVTFKSDATLAATAGTPLEGGTNTAVTGTQHQAYLDAIEPYSFNVMGVAVTDETIKGVYAQFIKRLRDESGKKAQVVLFRQYADYEGVISVENTIGTDPAVLDASAVYWVAGVEAGLTLRQTALNMKYDGEYDIYTKYSQTELENALKAGKFIFHLENSKVHVLDDINTLVTISDEKGEEFKENQTIRTIDAIATDTAILFKENYLGLTPNDSPGRISLWNDIVKIYRQIENMRAIEDFDGSDITVEPGEHKGDVVVNAAITVTGFMKRMYTTVVIS